MPELNNESDYEYGFHYKIILVTILVTTSLMKQ
jgi:hypothetical protein